MATANIRAVITADDRASATLGRFGDNVQGLGDKIASALKTATVAAGALAVTGIGAAVKASWDQVDAVQQATLALNAYEKDGRKVNAVLTDLVSYARSDMGVLFNRKDLFGAAQSLKIYGDNTDKLTDHVKIMSRSVGLGLSTWEGLNNVIGRVGSTGKLYADDLQYLQNAGFKIDGAFSGTTQTFESLFDLMDKGIPTDALAGQAETIKGKMIRLETGFRNVGDAILGVDRDSGKFIKGGLGDELVKMLDKLVLFLKTPEMKEGFTKLGRGLADFSRDAAPVIKDVFLWIVDNRQTVVNAIGAIAGAFVLTKTIALIEASIVAGAWIASAISSSVAFGTMAISAAANSSIATAAWVGSAAIVRGAMAGLAALVAVPMVMPAIVVVAALAALGAVIAKTYETIGVIKSAGDAIQNTRQSGEKTDAAIRKLHDEGKISTDRLNTYLNNTRANADNTKNSLYGGFFGPLNRSLDDLFIRITGTEAKYKGTGFGGRAVGGPVSAGTPYVVGEQGRELFVPSQNGRIVPNHQLESTSVTSGGQAPINITIQAGAFVGSPIEARKFATMIMGAYADAMAAKGGM